MSEARLKERVFPPEWRRDKLFRLCETIGSGGTPDSGNPDFYGGEIPWVQTGDLTDGVLEATAKTLTAEGVSNSATRYYPPNTLLIAMYGATIGKLGVIKNKSAVNQACCAIVPRKSMCMRFIFYKLLSLRSNLISAGRGGGQQNISQDTIKQIYLSYPTLDEQQNVADYLDSRCSAIDLAIEAKKRQIDSLVGVKRSLLQRVVTRGKDQAPTLVDTENPWLEQIPKGWSLVMLKRLADIQSGLTLGKVYDDKEVLEYPYLRVANVQDGYVDLEDVSTLEVPSAFATGVMLRAGDVLMTEGGDLDKLGRGTVWGGQIEPCLHQNHVFAVRCYRHKLLPHFLAYVTAAQYGRDYFEATGKRTTNLAATNSTKVGMFYIPLPPLKEQRELVRYLDTELGQLAAIEANIGKQIDTLLAYRKSLIHECVTGKRRVSSADFSESAANA